MRPLTAILTAILCISTFSLRVSACDGTEHQAKMASFLYRDADYRQFVCGDAACTQDSFQNGLEYRQEVLRDRPRVTGCFVEPARKAVNFFTGFFVIQGTKAEPQFIFFGSGLGTDKRTTKDRFKLVIGTERRDAETWVRFTYKWNGASYVQVSSKRVGGD